MYVAQSLQRSPLLFVRRMIVFDHDSVGITFLTKFTSHSSSKLTKSAKPMCLDGRRTKNDVIFLESLFTPACQNGKLATSETRIRQVQLIRIICCLQMLHEYLPFSHYNNLIQISRTYKILFFPALLFYRLFFTIRLV